MRKRKYVQVTGRARLRYYEPYDYVIKGNKYGDIERTGLKMVVEVENVNLTNVWEEQFTNRETGEVVKYYRALVSSVGEPPSQLAVTKEDYENLSASIGMTGTATLEVDARPGSRVRIYLRGIE